MGYIGIMENKMEITTMGFIGFGFKSVVLFGVGCSFGVWVQGSGFRAHVEVWGSRFGI